MAVTKKVFNIAGGKHSAEAYSAFEGRVYGSCVAGSGDLLVHASTTNMNCLIDSGAGLIKVGSTYARRIAVEGGQTSATCDAASTTLDRKDAVVAYIDNSVTPTTSVEDNTNDILKFKAVAGTPAANPTAPNATTIQSSVGAGNPYMVLAEVLVPANASTLSSATVYDKRVVAAKAIATALPNGSIETAKIADGAVTYDKLDTGVFEYSTSEKVVGTWIDGRPLYEKTIKITSPTKDTNANYTHNIANVDIGFVKTMFVIRLDTYDSRAINYAQPQSTGSMSQFNRTYLSYRIPATDWNWADKSFDLYAVVDYVKLP